MLDQMSRGLEIRKAYLDFLSKSLSQTGARRRVRAQVGCIVAVSLVYALSFFDLYLYLYDVTPHSIRQFTYDFYPTLEKIKAQMAPRGDFTLFKKYVVFSQLNFSMLVLAFVVAFLSFQGRRDSQSTFGLGGYFLFCLGFVSFVLMVIFLTNDAGYGHGPKILVEPKLGLGEFFFIRDSFFIGCSAWIAVDLALMVRLMMQSRTELAE